MGNKRNYYCIYSKILDQYLYKHTSDYNKWGNELDDALTFYNKDEAESLLSKIDIKLNPVIDEYIL